jgi:hypothetical protein
MRWYKNISGSHLTVGIPGTGRLRRMEMNETLALGKEENKHIQGLCNEGKLKFVKDDDHEAIAAIVKKTFLTDLEELIESKIPMIVDKVVERLGNEVNEALDTETLIKEASALIEDVTEELSEEEATPPMCATCGKNVWPTTEGICPACGTDFNNPSIDEELIEPADEMFEDHVDESMDEETPEDPFAEAPEIDPVDTEPEADEDPEAPVVDELPEGYDEFGPERGTDAWKALEPSDKRSITRARKAAGVE